MKRITVRFYRSPAGKEPVRDWLKSLSQKERLVLGTDIKTVEFGWPIGLSVCRSLGEGLWEVRSQLPNRIAECVKSSPQLAKPEEKHYDRQKKRH